MPAHRFQNLLSNPLPAPVSVVAPTVGAFVACPVALLHGMSAEQRTCVEQVYRLAMERTQAQLRPSRWEPLYRPSSN